MDDAKPRRAGFLRTALAAALPLLLVVGTMVGLLLLIPTPAPEPSPTPTRAPDTTQPSASAIPDDFVFIQVGEDLVANPPEIPIDAYAYPDSIAEATLLGEREGYAAYGILTTAGTICMAMRFPEGTGNGGIGDCVTIAEFTERGMTIDRGAWDVHWSADGTVVWTGI